MGPRSVERGKPIGIVSIEENARLQWGRVLLNAERVEQITFALRDIGLQWGRVLLNAESHAIGKVTIKIALASMGPRSVERGKSTATTRATPTTPLQWGRVLLNAERNVLLLAQVAQASFNGAAFC